MQNKRFRFLVLLYALLVFVPSALAYWIWSPTESKTPGTKREAVQEESKWSSASTSVSSPTSSIVEPIGIPSKRPVSSAQKKEEAAPLLKEKVEKEKAERKAKPAKASTTQKAPWFQALTETKEKLIKYKFLKPVKKESEKTPDGQFWSPAEGKFVTLATAIGVQKSADVQFQNALELRKTGKEDKAIQEFRRLVRQFPQSAYAAQAQYIIASYFEEKGKSIRAAQEYEKLIRDFPRSEQIDDAVEHLFKLGDLFLKGEKEKVLGVSIIPVLSKAAEVFRFIVEQAPYGAYGDQSQLRLGTAYRKMGNFEEAVKAFETLIANYPNSPLVDEAYYQLAETSYDLAQNASRDQRTRSEATSHLKEFIKQYGSSTLAERARLLKQQLDEQDAEKNYRIGLYYEKQGFTDSAMIYYEDISTRYPQTAFGKKAGEKFQALNQPVLAIRKGKEANEQRLAEVRSMLQALDLEQSKGLQAKPASEIADLRKQLQAELTSLTLTQKQFKEESQENFRSRRKTLHDREKNLREKFKTFYLRKKLLSQNPSPELDQAFQKWEESLKKEQEELAGERKTLGAMGVELKGEKASWFGWVPYLGEPGVPSGKHAIQFQNKKESTLEERRNALRQKCEAQQKQLGDLTAELIQLDQKEFEIAKAIPLFQELFPAVLKKQQDQLDKKHAQLDESIQTFEATKKAYRAEYGEDFIKTLTVSNVQNLQSADRLIASGANLTETFEKLQKEKASLSEAWLAQKEKLNTLVQAVGGVKTASLEQMEEAIPALDSLDHEEQAKAVRILKKRMKYLEREVRSRMDQIQDWEFENVKRIDQLDRLLHPKAQSFKVGHTASKMLSPATGTYKLAKAFLFGLPNRDRELVEEARQKVTQPQEGFSSEQLKAIRELEEEIELQSVLIEGRAKEISDLERRLTELQRQAKEIPGFSYQSLLVERIPSSLTYPLTSAHELLGDQKKESIFVERMSRETRELERLEDAMTEINQKIESVTLAIERSSVPQRTKFIPANVIPALPGDAETFPTPSEERASVPTDEKRTQLESQLVHLKSEIDAAETQYQKEADAFKPALFQWYQTEARDKLTPHFTPEGKAILDQRKHLDAKHRELKVSLASLIREEHQVTESQKELLDRKLAELEKRLNKLKNTSDSRYGTLSDEIARTTEKRESLIHDLSFLESSLKN